MNIEPLMNYLADEEGPYGRVAMNGMPSYSPLLTSLLKKLLLLHLCLLLNWGERRERPEEASFSSLLATVILTKRLYYSPPCLTEEP